jgi:hypothetical protein
MTDDVDPASAESEAVADDETIMADVEEASSPA